MTSIAACSAGQGLWRGSRHPQAFPRRQLAVAASPSGAESWEHSGSGGGEPASYRKPAGGGGGGGSSTPSGPPSNLSATGKPLAPWTLTFDLKEKQTLWTQENQARLVRIVAGYQLDLGVEEVEARLGELQVLLPALAARCAYIKPSTLAGLLRDPAGALIPRLLTLRDILPGCDIAAVAAAEPELLLLRSLDALQADLARLEVLLGPTASLPALVQQQPRLLDADLVSEVMVELRRLMPGTDAAAVLLADPSWLLRTERGRRRLGDDPD